jgi:filamentous hemagglutinin family protein
LGLPHTILFRIKGLALTMKNHSMSINSPRLIARKLPLCAAIAGILLAQNTWAGPEGGDIVGGAGSITQTGNTTRIEQATDLMAIDWQSYNLNANERVEYIQPSHTSISLNTIRSHQGSVINGQIDANGHVFLVNPNGVVFGGDAQINVGGLLASGLSIDPNDFMNGNFAFEALEGSEGVVINSGTLNAATGGSISLLGQRVENEGLIRADLGRINLASGSKAVVSFDGGLLGLRVTEAMLQSELGLAPGVSINQKCFPHELMNCQQKIAA